MIKKEKMLIVSGTVDESIKMQTSIYDVMVFRDFTAFERYADTIPIIAETLILTTDELPFTSANMQRVFEVLGSPFMKIKGSVVYLIDETYDIGVVNHFLNGQGKEEWVVYQGRLTDKFISGIVSGEGRESTEGIVDVVMIRMRAEEYQRQQMAKRYEQSGDSYMTDEALLSGIPDMEVPEVVLPEVEYGIETYFVVGNQSLERSLFVFLLAQYQALNKKVLVIEKDWEYHTMAEFITKSGYDCELIDVWDMFHNVSKAVERIQKSQKKLVFLYSKKRTYYNYNFLMDFVLARLKGYLSCVIRECDFEEAPYGRNYTIVVRNNIPDILRGCSSLVQDVDPDKVNFVGIQLGSLGPANVAAAEMSAVIQTVLEKSKAHSCIMRVEGVRLSGEEGVYDIFGIVKGNNG